MFIDRHTHRLTLDKNDKKFSSGELKTIHFLYPILEGADVLFGFYN